jgi:hypothetical protein
MTLTNVPKGIKFIPPPIPLCVPKTMVLEHSQYVHVTLRMNPADENSSKYKKDIPFFKDGTPDEYLQWMKHFDSVTIIGLNITTTLIAIQCAGKLYKATPYKISIAMLLRTAMRRWPIWL